MRLKTECVFITGELKWYSDKCLLIGNLFIPESQVFELLNNGFWLSKWFADKSSLTYTECKLFDSKGIIRHVPKKKEPIQVMPLNELMR